MALSYIIFEIKQDINQKSRFFYNPPAFDAPVREGSLSEYRHNVWYEKKLECCMCHQAGEKMFEDIFARFDAIHERGRRTDERTLHDGIGCARHGVAQQERETTEPGA